MSKRNLSQAAKRAIRNEIRAEIATALKINVERGTVVTSRGDCLSFRVETIGAMRFVHLGGFIGGIVTRMPESLERAAKESASAAMLALGYTRS